jgi:hypothetical protein
LDSSIIQGPFSVAPCQTLISITIRNFFIAVWGPPRFGCRPQSPPELLPPPEFLPRTSCPPRCPPLGSAQQNACQGESSATTRGADRCTKREVLHGTWRSASQRCLRERAVSGGAPEIPTHSVHVYPSPGTPPQGRYPAAFYYGWVRADRLTEIQDGMNW